MSKYNIDKFKHVTVALNTPFAKDGSVDVEAVKAVSRYFRDKGVKQMYVCGSTGEGFLLDTEERKLVAETVVNEVGQDMNIIVHVGCADTRHSCILAEHAEKIGAAAISAVPCVYYRPSEESVYQHWTEIAKAADLPFFIYNIPQLTGFNLSMNLFNRMLENDRVAGVKCSSDPAQDVLRFKLAGGKDFIVFNGPDEQFVAGRIMGADAGIGGTYGAMPELYMKMDGVDQERRVGQSCRSTGNRNSSDLSFMLFCIHARCSKRNHHSGRMPDGRSETSVPACSYR